MTNNIEKFKSLFLKCLIGCLIAAAAIAVVTVIAGQFNDVLQMALYTILLIAIHCLISFGFIVNNEKQETFESLAFFTNATFVIIVFSFMTSVLGVWGVLDGGFVFRLYALYFVLLFAILHGEVLAKTTGQQESIDNVVYANYFFMVVVVLMLLPVIFYQNSGDLGAFYYRLLAAFGIIDATLTLVTVILHKLYIQKHPRVADPVFNLPGATMPVPAGQPAPAAPKKRMNIFVIILVGYLVLQFGAAIMMALIGSISRGH